MLEDLSQQKKGNRSLGPDSEMPDMALKGLVSPSGGSERTTGSQHWWSL